MCGSRGLKSILCTGPFTYNFVSYPPQCRRAIGGRRPATISICRVKALDVAASTTAGLTFDLTGFVTLRLHLGLWWAAGPQRAPKGHGCQKKVQRVVRLSLLSEWIKHILGVGRLLFPIYLLLEKNMKVFPLKYHRLSIWPFRNSVRRTKRNSPTF